MFWTCILKKILAKTFIFYFSITFLFSSGEDLDEDPREMDVKKSIDCDL